MNLAGRWLPIQSLSSDKDGIFVLVEEIKIGLWEDTWICPNPHCGYENYDSIKYCGICGTKKP